MLLVAPLAGPFTAAADFARGHQDALEFLEGVRDAQGLPPPESDSDFEEGGELSPPVEAASPPGAAGLVCCGVV